MNVLILAQYFPPDMGGGATRAINAAKGLLSAGCSVTCVAAFPHYPTGRIPGEYKRKLINVEYYGSLKIFRTFVPPLASEGLAKRILLFASFSLSSLFALPFVGKVDVVWAANPNIIAVFPSLIFRIVRGASVVQNVDDLWPESLYDLGVPDDSSIARLGEFLARIAYQLSSVITPISPSYVQTILSKYHIDPRKVYVVPAGIDLDRFRSLRIKLPTISDGKFVVLYIGAFSPAYDFDQVFKAACLLRSSPDIQFIIQGGGELASALKEKSQHMDSRNVTVLEKIVSRDEVARTLIEASVLLLPLKGISSTDMGISSKLYEYQAAGKPIVCCSDGQAGRYVSQTVSGIVVRPGDYEALADSILYLRKNPDISRRLGESGKLYVEKNMSTSRIGMRMKALMEVLA